jgi:aquaporin NIP
MSRTARDRDRDETANMIRATGAEAVGAFVLVFAGTGAVVSNAQSNGALGHIGIAFTFGLAIMTMIYAMGHLSGAHFNPAVTVAFALTRHFPLERVLPYIVAQILGATLGSLAVRYLFAGGTTLAGLGVTKPAVGVGEALIIEMLLTAMLMFVIMAVATDTRAVGQAAALAIGGTIALDALFGGPLTGASMNPARSLGPAIMAGDFDSLWLYIVGPIVGAALGALLYQALRGPRSMEAPAAEPLVDVPDEGRAR